MITVKKTFTSCWNRNIPFFKNIKLQQKKSNVNVNKKKMINWKEMETKVLMNLVKILKIVKIITTEISQRFQKYYHEIAFFKTFSTTYNMSSLLKIFSFTYTMFEVFDGIVSPECVESWWYWESVISNSRLFQICIICRFIWKLYILYMFKICWHFLEESIFSKVIINTGLKNSW